jgi:hypothetical protein
MAFSEIFSTSFLFSISIIIILIGGIFAYVNYRMGEQDHKLNSMIGLVSTMAEETQYFRSKLNMLQQKILVPDLPTVDNIEYASHMMGGSETKELIDVSDDDVSIDDDVSDDDVSIDDDVSDDDVSDDDVSDDDVSDDDVSDDEYKRKTDNVKILNLSLANIDEQNIADIDICDFDIIDTDKPQSEEIKMIRLEQPIDLEEADIQLSNEPSNEQKITEDDINFLKNVSINDLGDLDDSNNSKTDYKKMSLNKLREVAVSKGLISDASKLKKNEILKLLGDE